MNFRRKLEPFYTHSPFIAEFWNTISNAPFIIFGGMRLWEGTSMSGFYVLMILCGICSGIHHARDFRYSILLDWTPITISILGILRYKIYEYITLTTWTKLTMATSFLIMDHVWTPIPIPFGHVLWHISAAFAVDSMFQDVVFFW